ncbi:hypothetical protein CHCC20490_1711 [Bacillus paralicheniformis]|nr:hypothetical protein CHCC20490_1711 [Bacillus paralicheniformis]
MSKRLFIKQKLLGVLSKKDTMIWLTIRSIQRVEFQRDESIGNGSWVLKKKAGMLVHWF